MKFIALAMVVMLAASQDFVELYSGFSDANVDQLKEWTITGGAAKAPADNFFTCGSNVILGGPKAFGTKAVLARQFQLPPHYQVKVQVEVWKIDKWELQRQFFYIDSYIWETQWSVESDGSKQCTTPAGGNQNSFKVDQTITHNQASLVIVFTSSVEKTADKQSWGIRNLKLLYRPCPTECGTCFGPDAITCQMWTPVGSSWMIQASEAEGWELKTGGTAVKGSVCSGIPIIGGPGQFGNNVQLQKTFTKLVPHYRLKVVGQFWKIDKWASDYAQLYVDNQLKWQQLVSEDEDKQFFVCDKAAAGGVDATEKIINVNLETNHNYGAVLLKWTSTVKKSSKQASWGIRQVQVYVAKCAANCATCTGPELEDCTACVSPYVLLDPEDGNRAGCILKGDWVSAITDFQGTTWTPSADWQVTGGKGGPDFTNTCGDIKMFGGYQKTGSGAKITRKFNLPPHKRVRVAFEAWKIDDWFGEDYLVKIDGLGVWERSFGFGDPGLSDICGGEGFENYAKVDVIIGHEAPTLELVITTTLTEKNPYGTFALRDFQIFIEKPDTCATLYTQCNFTGKSFNMCEDLPNFQLAKYPSKIKSIQVPSGAKVVLFDEMDYIGKTIEYTENQVCIEEYNFKFLQQNKSKTYVLTANQQ